MVCDIAEWLANAPGSYGWALERWTGPYLHWPTSTGWVHAVDRSLTWHRKPDVALAAAAAAAVRRVGVVAFSAAWRELYRQDRTHAFDPSTEEVTAAFTALAATHP